MFFYCAVAITQTKELQYRRCLCPPSHDLDFPIYRLQCHLHVDLCLISEIDSPVNEVQNPEISRRAKFRSGIVLEACACYKTTATLSTYSLNYKCLYAVSEDLSPSKAVTDLCPGLGETSLAKRTRLVARVIFNSFLARTNFLVGAILEGLELAFVLGRCSVDLWPALILGYWQKW